jgi:hypothetical protein
MDCLKIIIVPKGKYQHLARRCIGRGQFKKVCATCLTKHVYVAQTFLKQDWAYTDYTVSVLKTLMRQKK